ncbi:MAG: biopolymer transporter ExbD [Phycisphaerales bacterium]|nr:biopolymer transporter ExbD [Phycisphaerales bacterium]
MKLGRRHRGLFGADIGTLPMTSMIDVVFLLLIFFMMTVSASVQETDLASSLKPQSQQQGTGADFQPQIVFVERRGDAAVFRLGANNMTERSQLLRLLRELPKSSGVVVRVANDVPVAAAAAALQTCKDAGFTKVSYVPAS